MCEPPLVAARAAALVTMIATGLSLRAFGPGLGLPFVVTKYGGSLLWAAMIYFLVALALTTIRPAASALRIATIACVIAVLVELSRLIHTPWLDAFRSTTAGALSLGRAFSLWNLLAYGGGILAAAMLDRGFGRRCQRQAVRNTRT